MVTLELLQEILPSEDPNRLQLFVDPINKTTQHFSMDTSQIQAAFLAEIIHESLGFTHLEENLNYSAEMLLKVWPSHFNEQNVNQYAHNPQAIANHAYANRLGNGNEASGDGWNFRGRGCIQITGRNNYQAFANFLGIDLESTIEFIETPTGAVYSAGWFWSIHNLNFYANEGDITRISLIINGGTIGLQNRIDLYNKILPLI